MSLLFVVVAKFYCVFVFVLIVFLSSDVDIQIVLSLYCPSHEAMTIQKYHKV